MRKNGNSPGETRKILAHEPVGAYRSVFYVCFILATLYLAVILARTV